ncbi:MAG: SemiSWEET transporter [Bacteroidota bacterium]
MDPTYIGLVGAALTTAAFIPQVIKTLKSGSTEDLSLATFSLFFVGTIFWFIYGWILGDLPMILANGITCSLSAIILSLKLKSMYQAKSARERRKNSDL